ncbi:stress response protein nst1 [Anaeramoeba flamelloides]|uniref:Stress response protein nst1 n=1 Tax=Anaeramoeba flamelloides TaxID=1746091 RepID=A0AAV7Y620_9EUKA|nr:stress response protein nst1 [Anaeramoeba flamelloides]
MNKTSLFSFNLLILLCICLFSQFIHTSELSIPICSSKQNKTTVTNCGGEECCYSLDGNTGSTPTYFGVCQKNCQTFYQENYCEQKCNTTTECKYSCQDKSWGCFSISDNEEDEEEEEEEAQERICKSPLECGEEECITKAKFCWDCTKETYFYLGESKVFNSWCRAPTEDSCLVNKYFFYIAVCTLGTFFILFLFLGIYSKTPFLSFRIYLAMVNWILMWVSIVYFKYSIDETNDHSKFIYYICLITVPILTYISGIFNYYFILNNNHKHYTHIINNSNNKEDDSDDSNNSDHSSNHNRNKNNNRNRYNNRYRYRNRNKQNTSGSVNDDELKISNCLIILISPLFRFILIKAWITYLHTKIKKQNIERLPILKRNTQLLMIPFLIELIPLSSLFIFLIFVYKDYQIPFFIIVIASTMVFSVLLTIDSYDVENLELIFSRIQIKIGIFISPLVRLDRFLSLLLRGALFYYLLTEYGWILGGIVIGGLLLNRILWLKIDRYGFATGIFLFLIQFVLVVPTITNALSILPNFLFERIWPQELFLFLSDHSIIERTFISQKGRHANVIDRLFYSLFFSFKSRHCYFSFIMTFVDYAITLTIMILLKFIVSKFNSQKIWFDLKIIIALSILLFRYLLYLLLSYYFKKQIINTHGNDNETIQISEIAGEIDLSEYASEDLELSRVANNNNGFSKNKKHTHRIVFHLNSDSDTTTEDPLTISTTISSESAPTKIPKLRKPFVKRNPIQQQQITQSQQQTQKLQYHQQQQQQPKKKKKNKKKKKKKKKKHKSKNKKQKKRKIQIKTEKNYPSDSNAVSKSNSASSTSSTSSTSPTSQTQTSRLSNIKQNNNKTNSSKKQKLCVNCKNKTYTLIGLPCRHLKVCGNCADIYFNQNCPICDKEITHFVMIEND